MIPSHRIVHLLATLAICFGLASAVEASKFAVIDTTDGPIVLELDEKKAPISVANFARYAEDGYYDNTVFHRVIPDFMIQGGGFDHHGNYPQGIHDKSAHGGIREPIKNEWENGLKNTRGSTPMAASAVRPTPRPASSSSTSRTTASSTSRATARATPSSGR